MTQNKLQSWRTKSLNRQSVTRFVHGVHVLLDIRFCSPYNLRAHPPPPPPPPDAGARHIHRAYAPPTPSHPPRCRPRRKPRSPPTPPGCSSPPPSSSS